MMQLSSYNYTKKISGPGDDYDPDLPLYEVIGDIYDKETKNFLYDTTIQLVYNPTGQPLSNPIPITTASYYVWTQQNPYEVSVIFKKKGYKDQKVQIGTLFYQEADVYLEKGNSFPAWQVAAVLAAVYLYSKRKGKKVGAFSIGDILPIFLIVGGLIAFDIIKDILEWLGLWKSKEEKSNDDAATDPNSAWNPNFYKTKPSSTPWTYAISTTTAKQYAKQIYDSFGPFNDCEECAIAVFKSQQTKSNVSFIAEIFQQQYGEDLLKFLRGGWWPQDRLSETDVDEINQYIKKLPNW